MVAANFVPNAIRRKRSGAVLIISMIFVLIFSALAVSMASLTGSNIQIASNQHKLNSAQGAAQSGLDIIRFWLSRVSISGQTPASQRYTQIINSFQSDLTNNEISNIDLSYDGSTINIPTVTLDSANNQNFSASITSIDSNTIQVNVNGICGTTTRTLRVNYEFGEQASGVFNFGVASRGPLHLAGNIQLEGTSVAVEASVYIESENSNLALSIVGNSQIAGDVSIVNPIASVFLQGGQAGIGGETGQDAIDNHVTFDAPPSEFPELVPGYFEQYIVNTVDSSTDTTSDATFENIRIIAGTNPTFSGDVTLKGIVYIETPNIVTFSGSSNITGIIVGNGDPEDNSGVNQINFLGNVQSLPVTELPNEEQFIDIKNETGTFLIAPGFATSFGGSFDTLNGAIAANGIAFFGSAGGTINGSIINYSEERMSFAGNADLIFNRSEATQVPAGFVPEIILLYDASSYSEIIL